MGVTAIVLTKNEAHNIVDCLDSLRHCDQVIVVDSNSEDATTDLAQAAGADVMQFSWNGHYPKKKQWALDHCQIQNRFVLYVDADERIPPRLMDEFVAASELDDPPAAMSVRYDYTFLGRRLRFGYRPEKIVLLDRTRCRFPVVDDLNVTNMWEVEGHYQPEVDGRIDRAATRMLHDDADDLYALFARHNRYSDWEVGVQREGLALEASSSKARALIKRSYQKLPYKGLIAFVHSYVLRLGFLDGRAGLHFAIFRGHYYWQTRLKELDSIQRHRRLARGE